MEYDLIAPLLAHSAPDKAEAGGHLLVEHLRAVEALAEELAAQFGLGNLAGLMGRCHDLGKASPAFQRRVRGAPERVDHSTAGGVFILRRAGVARSATRLPHETLARIIAASVLGHHAGLPDFGGSQSSMRDRVANFEGVPLNGLITIGDEELASASAELIEKCRYAGGAEGLWFRAAFAARMAFSAMVDADRRDTENYYRGCRGLPLRPAGAGMQTATSCSATAIVHAMRSRFDDRIATFSADTDLNLARREILQGARQCAGMPPGLFTMTVPTGGGKTLASMGFALDHAARHGHERVIYTAPFTSIIDQTADVYRALFGNEYVLEHHSGMEPDDDEKGAKIRSLWEDWRAPLVVTTAVQFFETLFSAQPSRVRKLASIANSIVVIDEVQTIPRHLLRPVIEALRVLASDYGCSIVLCTATQPGLSNASLGAQALDLEGREIAPDPERMFGRLQRNRIIDAGMLSDDQLLIDFARAEQGLIIVNSRKHALNLFQAAKARGMTGLVHLSTRQCAVDRRRLLARIRGDLREGLPCRVVATSLVEAGVDVDFPRVWRAAAGLDQIIQAGGRCNREGRRPVDESVVTIFTPADARPAREMAASIEDLAVVREKFRDLGSMAAIGAYFEQVNRRTAAALDEKDILKLLGTQDLSFREADLRFKMIESAMMDVAIPLDERAEAALANLKAGEGDLLKAQRDLQQYMVGVPEKDCRRLLNAGLASWVAPDRLGEALLVIEDAALYDEHLGLLWEMGAPQ